MSNQFDVIIIGGGNAGFGVSSVVAETGKSIAFVENWDFGGTCPNRGCTPKKVLVAAGHALHEIDLAATHCIKVDKPKLDWAALINRSKDMIGFIPDAMEGVANKRGKVFKGTAKFISNDTISVNGEQLQGKNIVIATGSVPRPLDIPGAELMLTSNEVLSETDQPDHVVFIGGGVIAMEFGHVFARAGTKVTILEAMPQLLPRLDSDAVSMLQKESERIGINIKTSVKIEGVSKLSGQYSVSYTQDGESFEVHGDKIINGTGRIANVAGLDLAAGGIEHDNIRIQTNEFLRSVSNPRVWVAGDALVTSAQLSPLATLEGKIVGHNIVSSSLKSPDYRVVPSAVYTVPALASVGLTEQQAMDDGLEVTVTSSDMSGWFSGKSYGETTAWAKVIIDKKTDQFVGAHIIGHNSEDIIHLFSFAMEFGIEASKVKDARFAFPSFSSDVKNLF